MASESSDPTSACPLLDLPDQVLTQILIALDTPKSLLAACTATRALAAVVSDECWEAHSATTQWLVRRRHEGDDRSRLESCEAHFKRVQTTRSTILAIGGETGATPVPRSAFIEAFDHVSCNWLIARHVPPPLNCARWRNAPCAAVDRGICYVVGGWDDDEEEALADVQTVAAPRWDAAPPPYAYPMRALANAWEVEGVEPHAWAVEVGDEEEEEDSDDEEDSE